MSSRDYSRRGFVSGAAMSAAAGMTIATSAFAEESASAQGDIAWDRHADVVIVGSGMGGMSAGVQALEDGVKNVLIVEISKWIGGGTSFSGGAVHNAGSGATEEEYLANTKHLNDTNPLGRAAQSQFVSFIEWIDGLGLPFSANLDMPYGAMQLDDGTTGTRSCAVFFDKYREKFEELGGTLLTQTGAKEILTTPAGTICGLRCTDAEGNDILIGCGQIILACGGWQNDSELKQRYLGWEANYAANAGTPYNTGAGIKMAQKLGASLQGDFNHYSGLYQCADPAKNWMETAADYEAGDFNQEVGGKWYSSDSCLDLLPADGILVNCDGKRFVDESEVASGTVSSEICKQRRASAVLICDDDAWSAWMDGITWSVMDSIGQKIDFVTSDEIGGKVFEADTLGELADALNATGVRTYQVHKANLLKTVDEYNAAAQAGTAGDLDVPHASSANPLVKAPFHAIPLRDAIYTVFGGLAVDAGARVLDVAHEPIAGLYAAYPTAGGFMNEVYTGAIACAGITGRWAADSAAAALGL